MNKDLKGVKEPADTGVGEVGEGGIPGRGNSQGEDPEIEVCLTLLMNCNAASVKKAKWGKSGRRGQVIGGGGSTWGDGTQEIQIKRRPFYSGQESKSLEGFNRKNYMIQLVFLIRSLWLLCWTQTAGIEGIFNDNNSNHKVLLEDLSKVPISVLLGYLGFL